MEHMINDLHLTGKLVDMPQVGHEAFGEVFYYLTLTVPRLSGAEDLLPVTISERLLEGVELVPGSVLSIDGQVRSYNSYIEAEHKNRLILTVFVRDIKIGLDDEETRLNPNEVILNGYICKPPIYRTTPFGREIADLLIAVNRSYNKSDYIPCIAWGRNARFAAKLTIGENIRIWGRMQSRAYQKKKDDGETVEKTAYEVSISKIEYLIMLHDGENEGETDAEQETRPSDDSNCNGAGASGGYYEPGGAEGPRDGE